MHPGLARMLDAMDCLAMGLREAPNSADHRLDCLVERSDAMLAVYPPSGARFQAHVDNTAGDGRRLTLLAYLNDDDWVEANGGALRVFPPGSAPVDILPLGGRAALFLADEMKHEVLPTYRPRYSCNVWYYDRPERDRALAQAKATGRIGGGPDDGNISLEEQAAAQAFLKKLLGKDGEGQNGGGSAEELPVLVAAAARLSQGAAKVVAQVVGAPRAAGPSDIAAILSGMTAETLHSLRQELSLMGMG